jgi:Fic family protein
LRSGRYVQQIEGYQSFIPNPLPPEPLNVDWDMQELLSKADRALQRPLLYLSYYFKKNKQQYYDHLQAIRDQDSWEEWLKFFIMGVYAVSTEATRKARAIIQMREKHREIVNSFSTHALPLLEYLFENPVINVNSVSDDLSLTYSTANRLIAAFEEQGILSNISNTARNRVYLYKQYLELFDTY